MTGSNGRPLESLTESQTAGPGGPITLQVRIHTCVPVRTKLLIKKCGVQRVTLCMRVCAISGEVFARPSELRPGQARRDGTQDSGDYLIA